MIITAEEITANEVRALSWKQPYASLMLYGKQETRVWATNFTGLVLICASLKSYKYSEVAQMSSNVDQLYMVTRVEKAKQDGNLLEGHAIAIGRLTGCQKMDKYETEKRAMERATFVNHNPDLYVHLYSDVRAIKPFPFKGSQGWRTLDQEQKKLIQLL